MSPTQFNDQQHHAKKESMSNGNAGLCPPPLKLSKDSHFIKKSSSSSLSSSVASSLGVVSNKKPQQQRHPVIIYTHSPKVIHTHPKDFMELVQKLTGLSRDDDASHQPKTESNIEEDCRRINDDNESSSVITDENGDDQVNSCFVPNLYESPPAPCFTNIWNTTDFLNQPIYDYGSFTPNMKTYLSSSSSWRG